MKYKITIDWPKDKKTMDPYFMHLWTDPNKIYRPWLEKNVGKHGIDWEWDLITKEGESYKSDESKLEIAFADSKKAFEFVLVYKQLENNFEDDGWMRSFNGYSLTPYTKFILKSSIKTVKVKNVP